MYTCYKVHIKVIVCIPLYYQYYILHEILFYTHNKLLCIFYSAINI
jgi:hypothetical protein